MLPLNENVSAYSIRYAKVDQHPGSLPLSLEDQLPYGGCAK